jgi:hypothetical protein
MLELTTVALTIVHGESVQLMACLTQVIEEDGGIEASGINDDGFHEFSGVPEWRSPGNSASRTTVNAKNVHVSDRRKYKQRAGASDFRPLIPRYRYLDKG